MPVPCDCQLCVTRVICQRFSASRYRSRSARYSRLILDYNALQRSLTRAKAINALPSTHTPSEKDTRSTQVMARDFASRALGDEEGTTLCDALNFVVFL
jgi:hypothetical protein